MGLLGIRKQTISASLPDKLKDQYCFKTEAAIKCLKFVKNMQNRTFISVGADAVSLPSVAAERWTLPRGGMLQKVAKK